MTENRNTGGGANIEGDVQTDGGNVTGRDDLRQDNRVQYQDDRRAQNDYRSDPSQSMRAGDNYFSGAGSGDSMQIWLRLSEHGQIINDLVRKMDDLPYRVRQLEKTEVVIRPGPEVTIRPVQESMSVKTLSSILIAALIIVIVLIAYLVYWTVTNGA